MTQEVTSGLRITTADAIAFGYCMKGCRYYAQRHGLSWAEFTSAGIPIEVFDKMNDGLGNAIAAFVRLKRGAGRGK